MKKEILTIERDIRGVEEIMIRSLASKFYNDCGVLFADYEHGMESHFLIIPDKPLLIRLLNDAYITIDQIPTDGTIYLHPFFKRILDVNDDRWIDIKPDTISEIETSDYALYKGIKLKLKDVIDPITINGNSFGMPLKISECNNFKYLIFITADNHIFIILRKYFKSFNKGFGFSIMTSISVNQIYEAGVECTICGKKFKVQGGKHIGTHKYYACSDICADIGNKLLEEGKLDQYIEQRKH